MGQDKDSLMSEGKREKNSDEKRSLITFHQQLDAQPAPLEKLPPSSLLAVGAF